MKLKFKTSLRDRGSAMVEFAIIAPVLFLLVFGIIEFGRAYNAQNTLTHAAREGIREYAITQDMSLGSTAARNAATSLDPTLLVVNYYDQNGNVTGTVCTPGQPATMKLEYPFEMRIAFWRAVSFTMESQGVMRCGG